MSVCAFTSVCEEDRDWIGQYLREVERLDIPFAIHLDRCSKETARRLQYHPRCVAVTWQNDPAIEFNERHKQPILDAVVKLREYRWALAWDVDETFERGLIAGMRDLPADADVITFRWLNLWGDTQHIRVDGPFSGGHHVKLYNLQDGRRWHFDHPITNGAKLIGRECVVGRLDLACLHHGMMTHELRAMHKARWDRIYSAAVGANPYGFWKNAIDTEAEAVTVRHGYS